MEFRENSFQHWLKETIAGKVDAELGKALSDENFSAALLSKLNGIATSATANDSDANLKARANHTGTQSASTISDLSSAIDARIANVIDGAPTALDTLVELAAALNDDPNFAATVSTALAGKVDKVSGKALSENDFTNTLKTKLDDLPTNATLQSALTAITNRLDELEAWRARIKLDRAEPYTVTVGANGAVSVTTSVAFTNPKVFATASAAAGAEGYHIHHVSSSGTTVNFKAFKNKTQGVLLGGTIDPDEPAASGTVIDVLIIQGA